MRDAKGLAQIVLEDKGQIERAKRLQLESVIEIAGVVSPSSIAMNAFRRYLLARDFVDVRTSSSSERRLRTE